MLPTTIAPIHQIATVIIDDAFGLQPKLTPEQLASLALQTRLNSAAMADNVTDMRAALSAGALLDALGETPPTILQVTPICAAARHGALKAVAFLIERGAKLGVHEAKYSVSPLMLAARHGHAAVFELLWTNGASRDADASTKETLLHAAASTGSIAMMERVKSDDPAFFAECLEAENEQACTPLTCALVNECEEAAFWLVRAGANINASGRHPDSSVLRWALVYPRTAFFDMLLAHPQFDPSPVTAPEIGEGFIEIILADAAVAGLARSVDFLLKRANTKADCIASQLGGTVLVATCQRCTADSVADIVALLIEHGAKVDTPDCDDISGGTFGPSRRSALVAALRAKSAPAAKQALVTLLLRAGANVAREIVLVEAAKNLCSVELVQLLVGAGAPTSMAAIFAGAEAGASAALLDVIGDAMEPPLDVNAKSASGDTLLHFAQLGCAVLGRLIDAGADIEALNRHGMTPLMVVRKEYDAEFFLLLERGADPNAAISKDYSVLHHAVSLGCPERVRRLLAAGADAKCRGGDSRTPLFDCVEPESVRLLVAAGASPTQYLHGRTPITRALRKPDVLRALLSFSGNFARDHPELLSLCLRHKSSHTDESSYNAKVESFADNDLIAACVQVLIDAGASCRAQNNHDGTVPLHTAVQQTHGQRPICVLLRNGAIDDLERKDRQGSTPREYAEQSRLGLGVPRLGKVDPDKHDGVLMLVAMGVEPLPTWVESLNTVEARKRIESYRFELVRQRAIDVLIALQSLSLSALEMVHIIEALSPVDCVPFEKSWKLATTVKHFKSKS
jgi:ankyrin repeat protein